MPTKPRRGLDAAVAARDDDAVGSCSASWRLFCLRQWAVRSSCTSRANTTPSRATRRPYSQPTHALVLWSYYGFVRHSLGFLPFAASYDPPLQ